MLARPFRNQSVADALRRVTIRFHRTGFALAQCSLSAALRQGRHFLGLMHINEARIGMCEKMPKTVD
ncbi:MAG: hypothetical protein GJ676_09020 [Rhodobacteraceae bacterium]|nr:hypothetical protein [Paracoccaceae bacterium]